MALPPPKRVKMGAFYRVLRLMELAAEFGYTTLLAGPITIVRWSVRRPFICSTTACMRSSDDGRFSGTPAKVGDGPSSDIGTPRPAKAGRSGTATDQHSTSTR